MSCTTKLCFTTNKISLGKVMLLMYLLLWFVFQYLASNGPIFYISRETNLRISIHEPGIEFFYHYGYSPVGFPLWHTFDKEKFTTDFSLKTMETIKQEGDNCKAWSTLEYAGKCVNYIEWLMSWWKYRFSPNHWSQAYWPQPVFSWIIPSGEWRVLLYSNHGVKQILPLRDREK